MNEKPSTRFKPGQSGNPSGRPKGSRNATTIALETLLDGQAVALTSKAVELALDGDMAALRLCMDRILPPRKDRPVTFALPQIKSAQDAATTLSTVLEAVAAGELTPADAGRRLQKLEAKRAPRERSGLSSERRKSLTDRAVLHGDQEALRMLSVCRPTIIPSSSEQRAAALAAGLRADI